MNFKEIKQKFLNISEKNSIIIKNTSFATIIKGMGLFISIFSMPAYIRFFNNEIVLGLWFTILSVLTWVLAFDLGIGNGLRNKLTEAITKKDTDNTRKYISSAYFSIGTFSIIMILIFLLIYKHINWNSILAIDTTIISKNILSKVMLIVFIGIIIQFFLKIITSILYALQKSFIANFLSFIISASTLLAVLLLPSSNNEHNLIIIAIIHAILAIIPYFICTIIVFTNGNLKNQFPSLKYVDKKHIKEILFLGGTFFYIQVIYMIIIATNEILITRLTSSANVVEYSIYYRFFSILGTLTSFLMTPIWSLVTKALTEKDFVWVKKLYKKLIKFAMLISAFELLIIPFLQIIVNIWLKENTIIINYWYALVFAIMGILMIFNSVLSNIANGMSKLKVQTICFTIGAVIKIALSIILVNATKNWIYIIISSNIAILIYCILQPIYINKELNKYDN